MMSGQRDSYSPASLLQAAMVGNLVSPRVGVVTSPGFAVGGTINLIILHGRNVRPVTELLRKLYGPVEQQASFFAQRRGQVPQVALQAALNQRRAVILQPERHPCIDNSGTNLQQHHLDEMVRLIAFERPTFYLRAASSERVLLEALRDSFDWKLHLNFLDSPLLSILSRGRKLGEWRRVCAATDQLLRGGVVAIPGATRRAPCQIVHPKASAFLAAPRQLFEDLVATGDPEASRLLQNFIVLDLSEHDGSRLGEIQKDWPQTVEQLLHSRIHGKLNRLPTLKCPSWDEVLDQFRDDDLITPWLPAFSDLPVKLAGMEALMQNDPPGSSISNTALLLLEHQVELLRAVDARREAAIEDESDQAMLEGLRAPRTFRELSRTYHTQNKERHWPRLAKLMASGQVEQIEGNRFIATTTTAAPGAQEACLTPSTAHATRKAHQNGRCEG